MKKLFLFTCLLLSCIPVLYAGPAVTHCYEIPIGTNHCSVTSADFTVSLVVKDGATGVVKVTHTTMTSPVYLDKSMCSYGVLFLAVNYGGFATTVSGDLIEVAVTYKGTTYKGNFVNGSSTGNGYYFMGEEGLK